MYKKVVFDIQKWGSALKNSFQVQRNHLLGSGQVVCQEQIQMINQRLLRFEEDRIKGEVEKQNKN